jgi:sec-independent protein translocase protein TatC
LKAWRYALIAITVASAVFTPSGDPLSMMALAIPLTVFYFLAIGIGKLFRK